MRETTASDVFLGLVFLSASLGFALWLANVYGL